MNIFQESLNIGELNKEETINRVKAVFEKYHELSVYLNVIFDDDIGGLTTRYTITPPSFHPSSSPNSTVERRIEKQESAIAFVQDVHRGIEKLTVHSGSQPRTYYQYLLFLKYINESLLNDTEVRERIVEMYPDRSLGSDILPSTVFYRDLEHALISFAYSFKSSFLKKTLVVYK